MCFGEVSCKVSLDFLFLFKIVLEMWFFSKENKCFIDEYGIFVYVFRCFWYVLFCEVLVVGAVICFFKKWCWVFARLMRFRDGIFDIS